MFFRKKKKKELKKIKKMIDHAVIRNQYQSDSKTLKKITQTANISNAEVIISLTSYSKRVWDLHLVLESIAQQTVLPNKVILWLAEDEFSLDDLPDALSSRISFGLDVRFCKDIKSYKKIIPTLELFPGSTIITIDDDVIYPPDTIERLLKEHRKNPAAIIGNRAHEVYYKNGEIMPYKQWKKEIHGNSSHTFLTGCGGILYPPNALHNDTKDSEKFMALCPYADDVWLYFMAKLNNTETKKIDGRNFDEFIELSSNNSTGLNKINVDKGYNDTQINNMIKYYNL